MGRRIDMVGLFVKDPSAMVAFYRDVLGFDREFERVVELGARPVYQPRDEPWEMRSSMVADPEGNLIEIGSSGG
jgi:catechol 2,3-dioxygenase-like lactoylglutathione lyase family enzyme